MRLRSRLGGPRIIARQTVIHLVDDVDGTPADETLRFELARVACEIPHPTPQELN